MRAGFEYHLNRRAMSIIRELLCTTVVSQSCQKLNSVPPLVSNCMIFRNVVYQFNDTPHTTNQESHQNPRLRRRRGSRSSLSLHILPIQRHNKITSSEVFVFFARPVELRGGRRNRYLHGGAARRAVKYHDDSEFRIHIVEHNKILIYALHIITHSVIIR